jgi:hypothetical protein
MSFMHDVSSEIHASTRAPKPIFGGVGMVRSIHSSGTPDGFGDIFPHIVVIVLRRQRMGNFVQKNIVEMMPRGLWIVYEM